MEPVHAIEYELTSALASNVHDKLLRWERRRGRRHDLPLYVGTLVFAAIILTLVFQGWILPGVGGGLLAVLTLFAFGALMRRRSHARTAVEMALLARHMNSRHVRIEFFDERVRMEMEYMQGQGDWSELDQLIIFDGFWVLQLANGGALVVPNTLLSAELEAFLRGKAEQVMAPVIHA
jgi:hypothetical protein